jgi:hypothetical protein
MGRSDYTMTIGVVHGIASCKDCDWETHSYKNAQALAAQHARCYGHHVEGELGISFSYTGTEPAKKTPRKGG